MPLSGDATRRRIERVRRWLPERRSNSSAAPRGASLGPNHRLTYTRRGLRARGARTDRGTRALEELRSTLASTHAEGEFRPNVAATPRAWLRGPRGRPASGSSRRFIPGQKHRRSRHGLAYSNAAERSARSQRSATTRWKGHGGSTALPQASDRVKLGAPMLGRGTAGWRIARWRW